LGEGGVARDWGGILKPLQMNAKTRSAEVFFSLGSSENVLTPGEDSQFYDTIFVFLPAAVGAREPANLSRGQADSEGKK